MLEGAKLLPLESVADKEFSASVYLKYKAHSSQSIRTVFPSDFGWFAPRVSLDIS
jgi:hypothetical protein